MCLFGATLDPGPFNRNHPFETGLGQCPSKLTFIGNHVHRTTLTFVIHGCEFMQGASEFRVGESG
jgi:hypothetical protein